MSLSDDEVDLLRHSLRLLAERRDHAAEIFYERLFEIDPALRPLFTDDILRQTEKAMVAFGAIVAQIQDIEAWRALTADLARRHLAYGVEAAHYPSVGEAVIRTLADTLEDGFTPEMEDAWRRAYASISAAMIDAAYGAPAERSSAA